MADDRITKRGFLGRGGAVIGCSAAAHPLMTTVTTAAAPWDGRLVVLILRGGMDGLDVVRPVGDPAFAALRPAAAAAPGLPLEGGFALHPGLGALMPLWRAGELGAVHAVSTPYRDKRSHFDGQDLLEAGTAPGAAPGLARGGWLNRLLQAVPGLDGRTAYAIGRERLRVLEGPAPVANWSPDAALALTPQHRLLLEHLYHDDPLFRDATAEAIALAELEAGDDAGGETGGGPLAELAGFAAARLADEARIAAFSVPGWDTHRNQEAGIRRTLGRLAEVILTLRRGLGPVWDRTTVLAMTEFGRTARQNGSGGTDHGTGGAMLTAGGAIRGGRVLGRWPGLGEGALYDGRDLMPTGDVRAYAAWAMRDLAGLPRGVLERDVFPGLDMGDDPRLMR